MKTQFKISVTMVATAIFIVGAGCSSNENGQGGSLAQGKVVKGNFVTGTMFQEGPQVDRLARPAINEGLIVNDATLNAFNSVPPTADLSPAAAGVRAEAVTTLTAFAKLGQDLGTPPAPPIATTVGAFLPDVMRIDTRTDAPPGVTAYNASTSGSLGILTGGRKPEDDVMDITLSFLVAGDPTGTTVKDNVFYAGVPGNPNQPGHKLLNGQGARLGSAKFPFLATPN